MKYKVMTTITAVMRNIWKSTSSCEGITLTELLVGVVTGSIVLTAGASGFINLLTRNQDIESKTIRTAGLTKALAYIQDDMKGAKSVTAKEATSVGDCSTSSVDSEYCLVLTYPDNTPLRVGCTGSKPKIYYGFEDISSGTQIWLKPGILKRKIICESGAGNWIVIADGLLGKKEINPVPISTNFCSQDGVNWSGNNTVYGGDKTTEKKGGFKFCLHNDDSTNADSNNRLVRVFLYGHINNGNPISLSTTTFTRSE
jgi:hypothetical protein